MRTEYACTQCVNIYLRGVYGLHKKQTQRDKYYKSFHIRLMGPPF